MRPKSLSIILLAATIFTGIAFANDKIESDKAAKHADIKKMMVLTGAGDLGIQAMNQMISAFKISMPSVPEKFWKEFMAEVDPNELVELCIPSYEKNFSHDEIKQLIEFYETPIGKKLIKTTPVIMQECMVAGQQWGAELGERVERKLREENKEY